MAEQNSNLQHSMHEQVTAQKSEIAQKLKNLLKRTEKKLKKMENELQECDKAGMFKKYGELLTINIHKMQKGGPVVTVQDIYNKNKQISIEVNPSLAPAHNIKHFFKVIKKLHNRQQTLPPLVEKVKTEIIHIKDAISKCEIIEKPDVLRSFIKTECSRFKLRIHFEINKKIPSKKVSFRNIKTSTGWDIYVGKNAKENDELTLHFAKPYDYWFHAEGAPGSHVVLRLKNRTTPPDVITLQEAASVAAYFSKHKKSKHVPVSYTQKKFVRKPKGSRRGAVLLDRQKTLFVSPVLPDAK